MAAPLFTGRVIAVIWDFDQTLIPGYQQGPLFEEYGIDADQFWNEVTALEHLYTKQGIQVSRDTLYLNHILTYVKTGRFSGLTNARLRDLGRQLTFYPGMPEFLTVLRDSIEADARFARYEIKVENYIVSTGLRQMMLGSVIEPYVKGIWGCEFIERPAQPGFLKAEASDAGEAGVVSQVGYFLDNTTKTRAIWEINKGTNVDPRIGVNDQIAESQRRVPIPHMLYIADGPSDIPVFSILNNMGGQTLGVHNGSEKHYEAVRALEKQARVKHFCQADYRAGQDAHRWILATVRDIAEDIVKQQERLRADEVRPSSGHVT